MQHCSQHECTQQRLIQHINKMERVNLGTGKQDTILKEIELNGQ